MSRGAGSGTRNRGWLAALSETAGRSREVVVAAGRARSWLQPGASAQPTPNSSPAPTCKRTWMEPSAVAEPQDNRHSNGPRSWLVPCATAETQQAKRHRISEARVQCPESSERRLHLDLVTLMLATDEADHLTKYARDGMDSGRVRRVLKNPCQCTGGSRCSARQLPVAGVVEYCQRFHHLSEECQTHLISTSYETCGPVPTDKSTRTQWHLLGEPICLCICSVCYPGSNASHVVQACSPGRGLTEGPLGCAATCGTSAKHREPIFAELYMSAAEHLAEQDLNIGKVDDNIAQDAALFHNSSVQCPAPIEPLPDIPWNPDQCFSTQSLMAVGHDLHNFPVRYLQHGRLSDLWWQFLAWWHALMLNIPHPAHRPSYSTCWRTWYARWQHVLAFRKSSSHACCTECFKYMQCLRKGSGVTQ